MCHGAFSAGPPPKRTAAAVQSWLTTFLPRSISGACGLLSCMHLSSVRRLRPGGRGACEALRPWLEPATANAESRGCCVEQPLDAAEAAGAAPPAK